MKPGVDADLSEIIDANVRGIVKEVERINARGQPERTLRRAFEIEVSTRSQLAGQAADDFLSIVEMLDYVGHHHEVEAPIVDGIQRVGFEIRSYE